MIGRWWRETNFWQYAIVLQACWLSAASYGIWMLWDETLELQDRFTKVAVQVADVGEHSMDTAAALASRCGCAKVVEREKK